MIWALNFCALLKGHVQPIKRFYGAFCIFLNHCNILYDIYAAGPLVESGCYLEKEDILASIRNFTQMGWKISLKGSWFSKCQKDLKKSTQKNYWSKITKKDFVWGLILHEIIQKHTHKRRSHEAWEATSAWQVEDLISHSASITRSFLSS